MALLTVHGAMLAWSAARHSPTRDEIPHLVAGISHWRFGTFDLYRVNPPLVRTIAATPVLAAGPQTDWTSYDAAAGIRSEGSIASRFRAANGARTFALQILARWACIPFSLGGALICFLWARDLYGASCGYVAMCLWCLDPNVLAHAQLITPDVGAAATGLAAGYFFWRWLNRPGWAAALAAGATLGLAELAKTTWTVLFLLWPALWVVFRFGAPANRGPALVNGDEHALGALARQPRALPTVGASRAAREVLQLTMILSLALLLINAGYGFEGSFQRLGDYQFVSKALGGQRDDLGRSRALGNRFSGTCLADLPVPLPANYVMGIDVQNGDFESNWASYLRGQWRSPGWWYYYLYAMAIKVPLGTWLLVLAAIAVGAMRLGYSASWRHEFVLLAPIAVVLVLVSSQTGMNHHMRYVLPIFPFAFVWISKAARAFEFGWPGRFGASSPRNRGDKKTGLVATEAAPEKNFPTHRTVALVAAGAVIWSVTSSLLVYPHSLSYFNELVGGPRYGHYHLLGSNLDWGQDLLLLKQWYDAHPEARPLHVGCDQSVPPSIAGIEWRGVPGAPSAPQPRSFGSPERCGPLPGWYAVSVNVIHGSAGEYEYFLRFEPVAMAGYSIYIYHITLEEANRVRREFGLPEWKEGMKVEGLGMKASRRARVRDAFTLVEVLVVISVIGVIMALLLPAVQASREAGRRTQCASHVKQFGLAVQQHASACGRYPSNGWGYRWVGVPERGSGIEQPGGWIYNILGYLEQGEMRQLGRGLAPTQQPAALMKLTQLPLPLLACPTRSSGRLLPAAPVAAPFNADWADQVAKTDYAINEGDYITDTRQGPATLQEGDSGKYPWKDTRKATGIAYQRSEVKPAMVRDGLSMTYMIGEKYVTQANHGTADDPGYDQSAYSGVDVDINRWVLSPPRADGDEIDMRCFGSAHASGCHFVFCDGAVKLISYQIDAEIHRRLGNRQDGKPVDRGQF